MHAVRGNATWRGAPFAAGARTCDISSPVSHRVLIAVHSAMSSVHGR